MISPALMSSESVEWFTPPEVLALVRQVASSGLIGLDPCTSPDNPTGAVHFYTKADDGLSKPWRGLGLVYVNPPFGRGINLWTAHARDEASKGAEVIACLPSRTDTAWFGDVVLADAVCFWRGRLRFSGHKDAAPFPSVFAYWGDRARAFRRVFAPYGWLP